MSAQVEVEIRALEAEQARAFLARDVETLERLWHPQQIVNLPNNKVATGSKGLLELIAAGHLRHQELAIEIEGVLVQGDLAIVCGGERVLDDWGPFAGRTIRRRYTNVWRRYTEGWRLIARHDNVRPSEVSKLA